MKKEYTLKLISIFLIIIIELFLMLYINIKFYKGILKGQGLLAILLFGKLLIYNNSIKNNTKYISTKIILLSILVLIIFLSILPNYTYEKSKELIYSKYGYSIKIIEYNNYHKDTIPINHFDNKYLLNNRFYYFSIKKDKSIKHCMVDPSKGKIIELTSPYWPLK
ncbi:hypothetical protein [Clostridium tetani]|uniref:hypothetical protein n=1 Tax=Clostridium tetani TaxID=1513 RepID=UPI0024A87533|nr:hypothetical protein [Clostridium tetani]